MGTRNTQPERDGLASAAPGPVISAVLLQSQLPLLLLHD